MGKKAFEINDIERNIEETLMFNFACRWLISEDRTSIGKAMVKFGSRTQLCLCLYVGTGVKSIDKWKMLFRIT